MASKALGLGLAALLVGGAAYAYSKRSTPVLSFQVGDTLGAPLVPANFGSAADAAVAWAQVKGLDPHTVAPIDQTPGAAQTWGAQDPTTGAITKTFLIWTV